MTEYILHTAAIILAWKGDQDFAYQSLYLSSFPLYLWATVVFPNARDLLRVIARQSLTSHSLFPNARKHSEGVRGSRRRGEGRGEGHGGHPGGEGHG